MSKFFEITQNKILAFALLCVAASSIFVIYMQIHLTEILATPDWCVRAINAEKLAQTRSATAFDGCVQLMDKQVGSLALNSHIFAGIIALCLLVLMVIVVAGGKLSFSASKTGVSADIGRDKVAQAAHQVADAAEKEATSISAAGEGELPESEKI